MKQDNSQNTQSDINPVVAQVLDLLGLDAFWFEETKTSIDNLLKEAKKPENITNKKMVLLLIEMWENPLLDSQIWKKNREVSLAMVRKDPDNFAYLDPKFKNLEFWKEALKSMVKQRSSFSTLQKFISDNFTDRKILKNLRKYLQTLEGVFISDIEKYLISIQESSPKVYDAIFAKNLFTQKRKNLSLSSDFIKYFTDRISTASTYMVLEPMDKQVFDISIFKEYLSLSSQDMTPEISGFFISLRSLIQVKKLQDTSENTQDSETENAEDWVNASQEETRLDYHKPEYTYTLALDGCSLDMWEWEKLNVSQKELDTMTDVALNNYIEAVKVCRWLGLGFIFKHKHKFLSVICDIDYLSGEWISESKLLKILNKIGKNVWIPEQDVDEGETETTTSKRCFKTLWEARYQFRDIKSTGVVGWISYDPMKSDRSVVERALIGKNLFGEQWEWPLNQKNW